MSDAPPSSLRCVSASARQSGLRLGPGFKALFYKECLRFWKVAFQTIVAPVVTTLLYLLIFSHVLESNVKVTMVASPTPHSLIPGLVMMAVLQNAFANSSSSLIQSKMRSIIFILLPPITSFELFCAYVFGAMVRPRRGLGVVAHHLPVCRWPPPCRSIRCGSSASRRGQRHPRHARFDRRHLVGEVRITSRCSRTSSSCRSPS